MKINDGRKLSPKTYGEIRIRAVQWVQEGESPEQVIKILGFARASINNGLARYGAGGLQSLKTGRRTGTAGRPKKLNGSQLYWIYRTVVNKDPLQMKYSIALWTREMVAVLIRQQFGIKLSDASVRRLLRQLSLSCQKPLFRAYQQDPDAIEKREKTVFPQIKKRVKKLAATICFLDESGISSIFLSGTTWAPIGKTPAITVTGARFSLNMLSAIDMQGQLRFMVVKGSVSS